MGPDSSSGLSNRAARPKFSPNGRAGVTAAALIALLGMIGILGSAAAGAAQPGPAPQIGQPDPDFTATDSKGNPVRLLEYRGKAVAHSVSKPYGCSIKY
jgi:hypothetical protein